MKSKLLRNSGPRLAESSNAVLITFLNPYFSFFFSPSLKIRDVSYQSFLDSLIGALCLTPCRSLLINIGDTIIEVLQIFFYTAVLEHQDPRGVC
jgi:hypothetical protein